MGFYGNLDRIRHMETWNLMRTLAGNSSLPWLLIGDFNDILDGSEKVGLTPHPNWLIEGFKQVIEDY